MPLLSMHTIHEEIYQGCTIKIVPDDSPESPREWDNVGTMACWHRSYNLGDVQPKEDAEEYLNSLLTDRTVEAIDELRDRFREVGYHYPYTSKLLKAAEAAVERRITTLREEDLAKNHVILPLYLYDHSGITMRTSPFSCPWDSGQVDIIHCTMERAREEWTGTDEEIRTKARACLIGEVQTYDDFLTGSVVGCIAEDPNGEEIHAVWGYYPDHEYAKRWDQPLSEARGEIDGWCKERDRETTEKLYWETRDVITL